MEDLISNDATFELYHNTEGASLLNNRVLTTYPSEKSSFQVFLGLDGYSNFEDDKKDEKKETEKDPKDTLSKVDPEKIAGGITATAGAFGSVASTVQAFKGDRPKKPSRRKQLKEVCGAKPLLNKQKKATYNTCVADYNAGKRGGVVDTQTDSTPPPPPSDDAPNNKKKIIIGLVVVGVLAGVFIAYKKGLFSAKAVK
jgi:hypothetical protein